MRRVLLAVAAALALGACSSGGPEPQATSLDPAVVVPPSPVPPPAATATDVPLPPAPVTTVRVRLERRVDDPATAGFADVVRAALQDPRGWSRAGFVVEVDPEAPFRVVLAEAPEVDALCAPYTTGGRFSCQNGPVVALNADRWRTAVDDWPGTLAEYRTMLVNHEVGHLLGQHHPEVRCPGPGLPAPVMAQQSGGLKGCAHNPWPLDWEIACAARHEEPIAPPYEEDVVLTCGPDG